jgi:hypothetical protein
MYLVLRCKCNWETKDKGFLLFTLTKLAIFLTNFLVTCRLIKGNAEKRQVIPAWRWGQVRLKTGLCVTGGVFINKTQDDVYPLLLQYPDSGICEAVVRHSCRLRKIQKILVLNNCYQIIKPLQRWHLMYNFYLQFAI